MIKSVAVYCGHQFGTDPEFKRAAAKMGELLARNKIRVIFGGGNVGLMGTVAQAALDNGGKVIGVSTPHVLAMQEPAHPDIETHIASGVNERKQWMYEKSDAFIILPGGMGTLNEVTDILTMHQIAESRKPVLFLNTHKFWDIFGKVLVHMQREGFITKKIMTDYQMHVAATPEEIIRELTK